MVKRLTTGKSAGIDDITLEMVKYVERAGTEVLGKMFNMVLKESKILEG